METYLQGQLFTGFSRLTLRFDSPYGSPTSAAKDAAPPAAPGDGLGAAAERPGYVMNNEVLDALRQVLQVEGVTLDPQAGAEDFTPEKVADRILGYVESALNRRDLSEQERSDLLEQSRAAIEEGFYQADEVLDSLGVLEGEVAGDVRRTYDLVMHGLDRLREGGEAAEEAGEAVPESDESGEAGGAAAPATTAALFAASFTRTQSASLRVDTLDGDVVSIEFSRQSSLDATGVSATAGDSGIRSFQVGASSGSSLTVSVQGELDESEQQAIEQFIKRAGKLADRFFEGRTEAAFAGLGKLKFDAAELAGYSLNLSQTRTATVVAAYQQVATLAPAEAAPADPQTAQAGTVLSEAAAYGAEVGGLLGDAGSQTKLADPARAAAGLFGRLLDGQAGEAVDSLRKEAMDMLKSLVAQMAEQLSGPAQREPAEVEHGESENDE